MFSKLALFAAASMAVFAVALPSPGGSGGITNSCNGGQLYCCNSVEPASSAASEKAIGFMSIAALVPISSTIGLTCDPITAIGLEQNSCTSQQTCCSGNNFNGVVVVGCDNTNLGL